MTPPATPYWDEQVAAVAAIARAAARDVDERGEFPREAVEALTAAALLSPHATPLPSCAAAVSRVAAACASTGLIWAMHLTVLETLRRHAPPTGPLRGIVDDGAQLLLAGATSEAGTGGDIRQSVACADTREGLVHVEKSVPFSSYAAEADAVVITARAHCDAAPNDQVMIVATRAQLEVTPTGPWDAMGMRGTASGPAILGASVPAEHVLPTPFGDVCAQTLVPVSHTLWAACWAGIATDAVAVARRFVRGAARTGDLAAVRRLRLAEADERLLTLTALVEAAARSAADAPAHAAAAMRRRAGAAAYFNHVKVAAADLATAVVLACFELVGAPAYLSPAASELSLSRHLRDVLSAKVMISGDRIRSATGLLTLVSDDGGATG